MRTLLILILFLLTPLVQAQSFKIATLAPEGSSWLREMRAAADEVKQRTDGRVEFRYYPGGVMGDDATTRAATAPEVAQMRALSRRTM
jgi:TRAP-type C4-dicarboxylate transport system substrate-binding protein